MSIHGSNHYILYCYITDTNEPGDVSGDMFMALNAAGKIPKFDFTTAKKILVSKFNKQNQQGLRWVCLLRL